MRSYKPTQLFELMQNMDVTAMLFYGLTGPRGQRPITSGIPDGHMIDNHRTKIQVNSLLFRKDLSAMWIWWDVRVSGEWR